MSERLSADELDALDWVCIAADQLSRGIHVHVSAGFAGRSSVARRVVDRLHLVARMPPIDGDPEAT